MRRLGIISMSYSQSLHLYVSANISRAVQVLSSKFYQVLYDLNLDFQTIVIVTKKFDGYVWKDI